MEIKYNQVAQCDELSRCVILMWILTLLGFITMEVGTAYNGQTYNYLTLLCFIALS